MSSGASNYNPMVPRSQGQMSSGQGQGMYMNLNGDSYQSGGDSVPSQVMKSL